MLNVAGLHFEHGPNMYPLLFMGAQQELFNQQQNIYGEGGKFEWVVEEQTKLEEVDENSGTAGGTGDAGEVVKQRATVDDVQIEQLYSPLAPFSCPVYADARTGYAIQPVIYTDTGKRGYLKVGRVLV